MSHCVAGVQWLTHAKTSNRWRHAKKSSLPQPLKIVSRPSASLPTRSRNAGMSAAAAGLPSPGIDVRAGTDARAAPAPRSPDGGAAAVIALGARAARAAAGFANPSAVRALDAGAAVTTVFVKDKSTRAGEHGRRCGFHNAVVAVGRSFVAASTTSLVRSQCVVSSRG